MIGEGFSHGVIWPVSGIAAKPHPPVPHVIFSTEFSNSVWRRGWLPPLYHCKNVAFPFSMEWRGEKAEGRGVRLRPASPGDLAIALPGRMPGGDRNTVIRILMPKERAAKRGGCPHPEAVIFPGIILTQRVGDQTGVPFPPEMAPAPRLAWSALLMQDVRPAGKSPRDLLPKKFNPGFRENGRKATCTLSPGVSAGSSFRSPFPIAARRTWNPE